MESAASRGKNIHKGPEAREREPVFYKELNQRQEMRIKHKGVISCVEELRIARTTEVL